MQKGYERRGIYTLDHVTSLIPPPGVSSKTKVDGVVVRMASARYKLFASSNVCVGCGLVGKYYALEKTASTETDFWHFNLYGINEAGHEVLFTKDHIIPKSRGGANSQSNYQTMCGPCNSKKGARYQLEETIQVTILRQQVAELKRELHELKQKQVTQKDIVCLPPVLRMFIAPFLKKKNGVSFGYRAGRRRRKTSFFASKVGFLQGIVKNAFGIGRGHSVTPTN